MLLLVYDCITFHLDIHQMKLGLFKRLGSLTLAPIGSYLVIGIDLRISSSIQAPNRTGSLWAVRMAGGGAEGTDQFALTLAKV